MSSECEPPFSQTVSEKLPIAFRLRCEPDAKELFWKPHCDLLFSKPAKLPANVLQTSSYPRFLLSEYPEQPACEFSSILFWAASVSRRRVSLSRVRWLSPVWLSERHASLRARARFLRGQILLPAYSELFLRAYLPALVRAFLSQASVSPFARSYELNY